MMPAGGHSAREETDEVTCWCLAFVLPNFEHLAPFRLTEGRRHCAAVVGELMAAEEPTTVEVDIEVDVHLFRM